MENSKHIKRMTYPFQNILKTERANLLHFIYQASITLISKSEQETKGKKKEKRKIGQYL